MPSARVGRLINLCQFCLVPFFCKLIIVFDFINIMMFV
jgi:hypothetical protein